MAGYKIETAKGGTTGTLEQVWAWQEEMQGSLAALVLPSGETVDVSECETIDDVRRAIALELGEAEIPEISDHVWRSMTELMDDEIREKVHEELAPCDKLVFLRRYEELCPEGLDGLRMDFPIIRELELAGVL
jgi:hypothetical protein